MSDSSMETRMDTPPRDALTTLWYFFTSSRWAALLLALLALTAVLAALGPHLRASGPASVLQGDATAQVGALGVQTPLLGLDAIRLIAGLWVRTLLAVFAFTLLLRLADRARLAFGPRSDVPHARQTFLPGTVLYHGAVAQGWTVADIRQRIGKWPGAWLMRDWSVSDESTATFCVENVRFTAWGDWVLHLGVLLVIGGLFVSAQWGWREDNIALAAGETYALGHSGYVLSAEESQPQKDSGNTSLLLSIAGGSRRQFTLAAFKPLVTPRLSLFQVSTGPALAVSARSDAGQPLRLQPLTEGSEASSRVTLKFAEEQGEAYLFVPEAGVILRIVRYQALPEEGLAEPVYLVRGYRGSQSAPLFSEYITEDTTFRWQTLTFSTGPTHFLVVNAVRDWGWWIVLLGVLLLLIGAALHRWPTPWVVCFRTSNRDVDPLAYEQVTLWGGNGMGERCVEFAQNACDAGSPCEL